MATKPTRPQERACDRLAQALLEITEAARLDGGGRLGPAELAELARRVAGVSTAFGLDAVVVRALEARGRALGLRTDTAELLTLVEGDVEPLDALLLDDDAFRGLVARAEAVLGED